MSFPVGVRARAVPGVAWLRTRLSPAAVAGLLFVLVAFVQVVVHPTLGYSDNGDFDRMTGPLGIALPDWDHRNGFVNLHLGYKPSGPSAYWSWLLPPVQLLVNITRWLGAETFDLRFLAMFYAVLAGVAIWLLVRALPDRRLQLVVGLLLVLVLGDSAFVAYLASFYSEPSSLIGVLLFLAAVLSLRGRRRVSPQLLIVIGLAAATLVLAKAQNVPLLLVLVPGLLLLRPRKVTAVLAAALVCVGGLFLQHKQPDVDGYYLYDTIFVSILPHSPTPAADLRELGLDPNMIRFSHRSVYHEADFNNPTFLRFWHEGGRKKLDAFYLHHPDRFGELMIRATRDTAELRPSYLGNRVREEGYKRTDMACELCVYSTTSRGIKSTAPVLLPALYVLAFVVVWRLRRRASEADDDADLDANTTARTLADGITMTALLGLLSFGVAIAGEGDFELVKHLYLFELLTGVLGVLLIGAGMVLHRKPPDQLASTEADRELALTSR